MLSRKNFRVDRLDAYHHSEGPPPQAPPLLHPLLSSKLESTLLGSHPSSQTEGLIEWGRVQSGLVTGYTGGKATP